MNANRYELRRVIGRGGMAEVFLARDVDGREVALKRVLPHLLREHRFVQRLKDEARIASMLSHPNIARVIELVVDDDQCLLALEFVDGANLRTLITRARERGEGLPASVVLYVMKGVVSALAYAHERCDDAGRSLGIIHRDVSASNVLVSVVGEVKLIDFGIAIARDRLPLTQPGAVMGKSTYLAPEQLLGQPLTPKVDIYAAGVLFHQLACGAFPAIAAAGPSRRRVSERLHVAFTPIIARCIDDDPRRRPSARELCTLIEELAMEAGDDGHQALVAVLRSLFPDELERSTQENAARTVLTGDPVSSRSSDDEVSTTLIVRRRSSTTEAVEEVPLRRRVVRPRMRPTSPWIRAGQLATGAGAVSTIIAAALLVERMNEAPSSASSASSASFAPSAPPMNAPATPAHDDVEPPIEPLTPASPHTRRAPATPGLLQVRTASAARVDVDGRWSGTTPLSLALPAGAHAVTIVGDDGAARRWPVSVRSGAVTHLFVRL